MTLSVTQQITEVLIVNADGTGGTTHNESAQSNLSLSNTASQNFKVASATTSLSLTVESTGELAVSSAESNLSLSNSAVAEEIDPKQGSNNLNLTQSAVAEGPKTAIAQNSIGISVEATAADQIAASAEPNLSLSVSAKNSGTRRVDASASFELSATADTQVKLRTPSSTLNLTQDATVVKSKHATSTLNLSVLADKSLRSGATTLLLGLNVVASSITGLTNSLDLSVEAEVYRSPASYFTRSELDLEQTAGVQKVLNLSPSTSLNLTQKVGHYLVSAPSQESSQYCKTVETKYTPFGGGGVVPLTLASADVSSHTTGVNLRYPFDTGATSTVTLNRGPNFGDIQRFGFDRINRETRGGTLIIYADPQWPQVETLLFTISAVRPDPAGEILTFLKTYLGVEIGLLTHEGRLWKGVIVNPDEAVVQDRKKSYTINLEFVGTEV